MRFSIAELLLTRPGSGAPAEGADKTGLDTEENATKKSGTKKSLMTTSTAQGVLNMKWRWDYGYG